MGADDPVCSREEESEKTILSENRWQMKSTSQKSMWFSSISNLSLEGVRCLKGAVNRLIVKITVDFLKSYVTTDWQLYRSYKAGV